jgi:hypothetical protein
MHAEYFHKTTIGADYLKTGKSYSIDTLLDYLSGLKKMQTEASENEAWKYNYEIDAVKEILKIQTA